jgi:chemotaxis regulatin CheY-phosphate phosphatase CheZ
VSAPALVVTGPVEPAAAQRLTSYSADLEATVKLMYQLVREIYAMEADGRRLDRIHDIAEALDRRPSLAALPQVLLKAYSEITGALGGIRLSRETIQVHAVDRIRHTKGKLAEVSSATETATTELLNGLDRALGHIDKLEQAAGTDAGSLDDGRTLHQALRDEVNGLFNVLQFQDITAQQLSSVYDLLADVEARLVAVSELFDPAVADEAPLAVLQSSDPTEGPKTYDHDASTKCADLRQSLADAVLAEMRRPVQAPLQVVA